MADEVLVLGAGIAGLTAALAAREAGAAVRVLERAPRALRGGNTRHTRNMRVAHGTPTALMPDRYPVGEFAADLAHVTGGACDRDLADLVTARSATLVDRLAGFGVRFQPTPSATLPASRKTAFLLGGGRALVNALTATAERRGVVIRYGACADDVAMAGDRVRGAVVGGAVVEAGAVVVATGGRQAGPNVAPPLVPRGTPFDDGRLFDALLAAGIAPVGDAASAHLVPVDARGPAVDGGIATRIDAIPFGIVVDRSGRRLADERADRRPTHYARWGPRIAAAPGGVAALILDAAGERAAPPAALPAVRAGSVAELAAALGVDPDGLAETLAAAEPPLEPPLAGYPLRAGLTFHHHGLAVDAQARLRRADGTPVRNLFAAGVIMAANVLGRGYLAGLGLTIGAVFGDIAGREAARHVLSQ